MITVRYGNVKFQAVDRWSEITLDRFIGLSKIEMPEKLLALCMASAKIDSCDKKEKAKCIKEWDEINDSITPVELGRIFPVYYLQVIKQLSNIKDNEAESLSADVVQEIYDTICRPFILSLLYVNPLEITNGRLKAYVPPGVSSFEIDGERYYFPDTVRILGKNYLMGKEPVISFAEACDIDTAYKELLKGIDKLTLLLSVYCRKKDEPYSENIVIERQELFLKTPMDIVWSLFFYIDRHLWIFMSNSKLFLLLENRQVQAAKTLA
jgi:hypothetical protein